MEKIDYSDVQGLVFSGYGKMKYACYHPLTIGNASKARQWLSTLIDDNRITKGTDRKQDWCLNIAISYRGFQQLGVADRHLNSFEFAFQDGMDSDRRSTLLQDTEESYQLNWVWGNRQTPIDVLLMIFGKDKSTMDSQTQSEQRSYEKFGLSLIVPEPLCSKPSTSDDPNSFHKEHFGFADGISQPLIKGFRPRSSSQPKLADGQMIATGEFLLGYTNEYDRVAQIPTLNRDSQSSDSPRPFGLNGTYLVFRQLEQSVEKFWNYFNTLTDDPIEQEWLASKCVGRWPSGALITDQQTVDPGGTISNDFDFADTDPHGFGCPLGSHIRRANPRAVGLGVETPQSSLRVARRHRILRRGRNYGPLISDRYHDDGESRGLFFLCLNSNIERQFEFMQNTWINNVKFNGLYDEKDPIIGSMSTQDNNPMSIPQRPIRKRLHGVGRFVTTRGGGYFFLPGMAGLKYLGQMGPD